MPPAKQSKDTHGFTPQSATRRNALRIPDEAGKIRWADIFGNNHPVELEIGSGKGTFLLAIAQALPEHNYVGIEWAKQYADFASDRAAAASGGQRPNGPRRGDLVAALSRA